MPKLVTLNNKSFEIAEAGDQNYGEDQTAYLVELATVINSLKNPLDITQTEFTFQNNQLAPADVDQLAFFTGDIASFIVDYVISRDNGTTKIVEQGQLIGHQGTSGWEMSRANVSGDVNNTNFPGSNGDIGVELTITTGGQVQYTSNNYPGQTVGIIAFLAKTVSQS